MSSLIEREAAIEGGDPSRGLGRTPGAKARFIRRFRRLSREERTKARWAARAHSGQVTGVFRWVPRTAGRSIVRRGHGPGPRGLPHTVSRVRAALSRGCAAFRANVPWSISYCLCENTLPVLEVKYEEHNHFASICHAHKRAQHFRPRTYTKLKHTRLHKHLNTPTH